MCLLSSAARRPASKPANVSSVAGNVSSDRSSAVNHVDGGAEEQVKDAGVRGKSSADNSSRDDNKSDSANDAGCGSKKTVHNIKLSSPSK